MYALLSIVLYVLKNLFLKRDLFMISLLNFLFIKGNCWNWWATSNIFFNGACLATVIFTDSFNVLNGTFCSLCNFDIQKYHCKSFEPMIVNNGRLLLIIIHFHNCTTLILWMSDNPVSILLNNRSKHFGLLVTINQYKLVYLGFYIKHVFSLTKLVRLLISSRNVLYVTEIINSSFSWFCIEVTNQRDSIPRRHRT